MITLWFLWELFCEDILSEIRDEMEKDDNDDTDPSQSFLTSQEAFQSVQTQRPVDGLKVCELPVRVAKMEGGAMETEKVSAKRELKVLTVKKKVEIFEAVDKGGKKGQIAKDFKIPASTLSTILKDREKIKRLFELKKGSMKKIRIEILN
ncbi:hypothetical protein AVEN_114395-1 [Araneus ventricosus]|uniref:HTH psq-type domain-containing protein n=1 Tax=Araneus ventricosus TaxID=182803 RepID=A0A4Y2SPA9_ARAVE|nr:hypothetical protein AVEN_114395-1 [Araneus ventricosus]